MFSFFRRSKKENVEKKNKEKDSKEDTGTTSRRDNESSKNNIQTQKAENALQGGQVAEPSLVTQTELLENAASAILSSNLAPSTDEKNENNENLHGTAMTSNLENDEAKGKVTADKTKKITAQPLTYASMLRKTEPVKITHCVKPCGHGTVAVTPKIPIPSGRKNSLGTPPESPKLIFSRKNSGYTLEPAESAFSFTNKSKDISASDINKPDVVNDTVKEPIKPELNPPAAPVSNISENKKKTCNIFEEEDIK